jgi:hypothetical protein
VLEGFTQHPYWQWLPVMIVVTVISVWLGRQLWLRAKGVRRIGLLVDYRASRDEAATSWAAIIEWHDEEGISRTFVDIVARSSQPWPVGTTIALAVSPDKRTITVLGPAAD